MNIKLIHKEMSKITLEIAFEDNFSKRQELLGKYIYLSGELAGKRCGSELTIKKLKEDLKCQNK